MFNRQRLIKISLFLILGLALMPAFASESDDWSRWRGNQQNGSTLVADGVPLGQPGFGLKIAWQKELGSAYSSISVKGNQAVTMYSDGTDDWVVSMSHVDGSQQWRYKIGATYKGHNGSHDGPNSTPIIEGERVFGLGPFGELFALSLDHGKELWRTHLVDDHQAVIPPHGFTTVPLVFADMVMVETGAEQKAISAFKAASGELAWSAVSDQVNYESPITVTLAGLPQVVCAGRQYVMGLDPQTGAKYWEYEHNTAGGGMNPLAIGNDRLFLASNGRESAMIQISGSAEDLQVKELWRSPNLTRSFNIPVEHNGHLFGYTGRFLTCLNAETGELAWKSRPPGDGFLIVVDDFLVIQTKRGGLHVAKAVGDDYHEVASVPVFDSIVWTPPSFASGKIFTRSLEDIAAVEIAKVDQVIAESAPPSTATLAGSQFQRFIDEVKGADDRVARLEAFVKEQKQLPVIEGDRYAHFVYYGEAKDLALIGDMIDTNSELPLQRVPGTDFFYASFELEPDARLNYRFNKDFGQALTDPRNDHTVPSFAGEMSQVAMPKWRQPSHFATPEGGLKGTMDTFDFTSKVNENPHSITVYLPPGYADGEARYPTVYVNYGSMAISAAQTPNTLENMIRAKQIAPVIAVFIEAPNSGQEYARQLRDSYAQMVAEEIVPAIDGKYRTLAEAKSRAFMGCDEGGYAAIYTAFKHPGVFSMLGGQSTHLLAGNGGEEILALVENAEKQPVRFYLDWGKYDYRNQQGGYDWAALNRSFTQMLKDKGYRVDGGEHNQGWGWASWRTHTDRLLLNFFGSP